MQLSTQEQSSTPANRLSKAMDPRHLVLVVDDEVDLVESIAYSLEQERYRTRRVHTGSDALSAAQESPAPDLILLDVMLPDMSGTEVCRELRALAATRGIPVIMLTARDAEIDRVVGFEVGADDYVTKPFSMRELLLRVRALLRRSGVVSEEEAPEPEEGVTAFRELRVDPEAHQVWVSEDEIALTALEFRLLHTLLQRRGRVQTRNALLEDVWGVHGDVTTRTVDTHIKRLREKLRDAGGYIETIRGVGYRFHGGGEE